MERRRSGIGRAGRRRLEPARGSREADEAALRLKSARGSVGKPGGRRVTGEGTAGRAGGKADRLPGEAGAAGERAHRAGKVLRLECRLARRKRQRARESYCPCALGGAAEGRAEGRPVSSPFEGVGGALAPAVALGKSLTQGVGGVSALS